MNVRPSLLLLPFTFLLASILGNAQVSPLTNLEPRLSAQQPRSLISQGSQNPPMSMTIDSNDIWSDARPVTHGSVQSYSHFGPPAIDQAFNDAGILAVKAEYPGTMSSVSAEQPQLGQPSRTRFLASGALYPLSMS
jgi:hypothetical protein